MSEITGKIIKILEPVSGEGKNGSWKKQEYILETEGEYPKKVCVANWNDKVSPDILQVGMEIKASINIESREFNERWYTDVKMWKAEKVGAAPQNTPPDEGRFIPPEESDVDDGLPF
jgi:hypothetical protein